MLSVIVLHYGMNQVAMTKQCLDRIRDFTTAPFETVLWVNGEMSAPYNEILEARFGSEERLGLAAAYNRALEVATGDMIAVLHNDCFVPEGWNEVLEAEAACGNIAFPMIRTDEEFLALRGLSDVTGGVPPSCCFMLSREALIGLGGWDEQFEFCHYEDMDLFYRATKAGMRLKQCPVTVFHVRGMTRVDQSEQANAALKPNELRYAQKHGVDNGRKITYFYPVLELYEERKEAVE